MKLDRKLNLVIPIETETKGRVLVHSAPISRDVFEQFYLELGKVFTQCFDSINQAHLALSAPQLAYPALKKMSMDAGTWETVKKGFVNEIIRLTNVLIAGEKGWESIPLDLAIKREILDEDEESEVLSAITFFTAICRVAPKELRSSFLEMAGSIRNWELTLWDSTEYQNGLVMSAKVAPTGKKAKASSIVS
jgi:hypothetical protein